MNSFPTSMDFQLPESLNPSKKAATMDKKILRILDANLNRTKEALRVCEDIARFILDRKSLTKKYKVARHRITNIFVNSKNTRFLKARNILKDIGKGSIEAEFRRKNIKDVFYANSQRAKESIRVLEEFSKLTNRRAAEDLKKIRYQVYDLERIIAQEI